jgi:2'-5' RNA ligase
MRRLFVAIEVPPEILAVVTETQQTLKRTIPASAVKWTQPHGIHLTLKFLGDVPVDHIKDIVTGLNEAALRYTPFTLYVAGLGCFPNTQRPRVLWLGLTGSVRDLAALQQSVEAGLSPLGYPTEARAFHPHLTLARASRNAQKDELAAIGKAAECGVGELGDWTVEAISLIRSQLGPGGAVYTREAVIPLD